MEIKMKKNTRAIALSVMIVSPFSAAVANDDGFQTDDLACAKALAAVGQCNSSALMEQIRCPSGSDKQSCLSDAVEKAEFCKIEHQKIVDETCGFEKPDETSEISKERTFTNFPQFVIPTQ